MIFSYVARIGLTLAREARAARVGPLEETRLPMRVSPLDLDVFLHMNNGRYLTLMDIGRFQFTLRTGALAVMRRERWQPVLGAATVRYLRELAPLQRFELATRMAGWDEKWFYFEQRFEAGGQLHARGLVKAVLKRGRKTVPPVELVRALGSDASSPAPADELDAAFSA